jgi:hypothetical protein
MSGGTSETHKDSDYMFTGTHHGADGATYLYDKDANFKTLGVHLDSENMVENVTQSTYGVVKTVTDSNLSAYNGNINVFPITFPAAFPVTWNYGDTYKIYKTETKNSVISSIWTDLSAGWRSDPDELINGWRAEDIDIDDRGRKKVFGPNQPERN